MAKPGPEPGSPGARRIAEAHRGSHEHDQQGGFASKPSLAREAGKKGGETVKNRYGHDFYQSIGKKGGETVKRERGADFYAQIGRKGGEMRGIRAAERRKTDIGDIVQIVRKRGRPRKSPV
jgi:general stress protein YciG